MASEPTAGSPLAAALTYLRRGFSIIPLVPRTKRPAVALAPYLDGTARMTDADVWTYWTAHPGAGVGIVTGPPSGLVVIDVDPRHGGDLEAAARDCPTELASHTGGGGLHLFVRYPGGVVTSGKTSRPGVDRKARGGFVVAPPSCHPETGEPYRWLREGEPSDLPSWALEAPPAGSSAAGGGEDREPWIAATLASPATCLPGAQHETLTRLAWWAAKNLPEDIALGMLTGFAAQLPLSRPSDPWTDAHVKELLASAARKRAGEPTSFATHLGAGRRPWVIARDVTPQVVDWLWVGRLALGKLTVLDGDPAQGKSTLALDLAARISTGAPMPGETTGREPRGVVIVNYEDGVEDTIRPRLEAAGADLSRALIFHLESAPTIPNDLQLIENAIAEVDAAFLVIDPLMAGVSDTADSHNDHKMRRVLRPLAALVERTRVAALAPRHRPKGGGRNAITSGNGSIAIIGAARCGLMVANDPDAGDDPHAHVLAGSKSNLSAAVPTLRYRTVGAVVEAGGGRIETSRIEWLGTSTLSGDAIVAREAAGPARRDAVGDVMQELRDILKDGPKPATEVFARTGRDRDDWTLRRARAALGVQSYQTRGSDSVWMWSLPVATEPPDIAQGGRRALADFDAR